MMILSALRRTGRAQSDINAAFLMIWLSELHVLVSWDFWDFIHTFKVLQILKLLKGINSWSNGKPSLKLLIAPIYNALQKKVRDSPQIKETEQKGILRPPLIAGWPQAGPWTPFIFKSCSFFYKTLNGKVFNRTKCHTMWTFPFDSQGHFIS